MRAWQVHANGEPDQMRLDEVPAPEPAPGQVRIRNHAAALNFFDILQIQGRYQDKPPFPFIPGAEVAGVIDVLGAGVDGFQPGQRVLAIVHNGGFAEYSVAQATRTFPIPEGMSYPEAAAIPTVYHTSYLALEQRAAMQPGEWLLVHAGASGVGMAATQIGKAMGARVIATAGSAGKLEFSRQQGADYTLSYSGTGWVEEVKRITGGHGADVIFDPVGSDVFDLSTKCIAPGGRLLVIGFAGGRIPSMAMNRVLLKGISIIGVYWGAYVNAHPDYLAKTHQALDAMYRAGRIRPVARTYRLEEAVAALRDLGARGVSGKAVLVIGSPAAC